MERRGDIPGRFALSPRCVLWDLKEVEAWLAELRRERYTPTSAAGIPTCASAGRDRFGPDAVEVSAAIGASATARPCEPKIGPSAPLGLNRYGTNLDWHDPKVQPGVEASGGGHHPQGSTGAGVELTQSARLDRPVNITQI